MGRGQDSTSIDVSEKPAVPAAVSEDLDAESGDEPGSALEPVEEGDQAGLPAAFELIAEACAAVKIAEDRASLAEDALENAEQFYTEQIDSLTRKLDVADRRAEKAERHAAQAEEKLRIFCQTILTTMHDI